MSSSKRFETDTETLEMQADKNHRVKRMKIAGAIIPAIFGLSALVLVMLLPNPDLVGYDSWRLPVAREVLVIIIPISFLFSGLAAAMYYLQTGFSNKPSSIGNSVEYERELKKVNSRIAQQDEKIRNMLDGFNEVQTDMIQLVDLDVGGKQEIIEALKRDVISKTVEVSSAEYIEAIETKLKHRDLSENIDSVFNRMLERLYAEVEALGRRGNLNLSLGIMTTIVGLLVLGYFVIDIKIIPEDRFSFVAQFVPRLSLVILIEVFAYFFLRLYKSSLSEIKYFQNEITNVESKQVALKYALSTEGTAVVDEIVAVLSNTERNGVLVKGQTTAAIEQSKIEQQNIRSIAEKVSSILGKKEENA